MSTTQLVVTTPTTEQVAAAEAVLAQAGKVYGSDTSTVAAVPYEVASSTLQPEAEIAAHVSAQAAPVSVPPTPQLITITPEQFAQYMRAVRDGFVAKKINAMGNEYTSRRNTLILRKVAKLYPDLVSDEDVVAYYDIYKMREAVHGDSKKVQVKDEEVAAYLELWTGETTPSLEAIENLIAKKSLG